MTRPLPPDIPGYWLRETTGILRPVIERYLAGDSLSERDCATMRAYLRQWINAPVWRGPEIEHLRDAIDGLTSRAAISAWLDAAEEIGIDPL